MQEVTLTIRNKVGLHARPAALFVQTANRFKSKVVAAREGREVNAKSILSVLSLGADQGAVVMVSAEGEDDRPVPSREAAERGREQVALRGHDLLAEIEAGEQDQADAASGDG